MAWIRMISMKEASGPLAEVYGKMRSRPMPAVYTPAHGDAPGIIRAHSLDPKLMALAFGGMSASLANEGPLSWPQRELVNAVTSLTNQCFY
jgi:hypothetical protein